MGIEVYCDPCTVNSRKVLAGLDLLGTQYHFNHIDYFKGEQKSAEFVKVNPAATVPAMVDGDLRLFESNSILQYAADVGHDDKAYPKDLKTRASINMWLLWEASAWFPSCYIYLVENVVKPLLKSEPDQSVLSAQDPRFHQLAGVLEHQLSKTPWLAGNNPTIADIAVAAPMHLWAAQKLPLDKYPHLKKWYTERVDKLPSWQKTQGPVDKALMPNGPPATNGAAGKQVSASFNYTKDVKPKLTELYFYESPDSVGIHEPGDDPKPMTVHDGRVRGISSFSYDREGFSAHQFTSKFSDWENEEAVKRDFYPDVVDFLKKQTGASRVLVFDHTIRSKGNAAKKLTQETNTSQRAPVTLVHCDYTAESGPLRVKQLLPDEADTLLKRRVAFMNVWKPIKNKVEESPLAMCDVQSAPSEDFFKLFLRYRERTGENYVMRHSDQHKWWYFPEMTTDEVIILKTYDSETDGRARFVGHSAFVDPTSKPDAPTRESVEIRTIVFF